MSLLGKPKIKFYSGKIKKVVQVKLQLLYKFQIIIVSVPQKLKKSLCRLFLYVHNHSKKSN